jgi:outer membrane protein assembly factor BamD
MAKSRNPRVTGAMISLSKRNALSQLTAIFFLVVMAAILVAGCGSTEVSTIMNVEDRFARAKALFDKRDYLEAINEFTVITLQYQGSAVAPNAQFYLGECRFKREEYLLAAFEYSIVKRNYPASNRVADASYKTALCYYNLSPKPALDQQYTKKAIDEFQSFLEYYPADSNAVDAEAKIRDLTTRLAKKEFDTARLYTTMEYYRSAMFYYDDVIEKYHDTEYAPLAYIGKVQLLMSRKKYNDASTEARRFLDKYPNSVLRSQMERLKADIDSEIARPPSKTEPAPGVKGIGL